MGLATFKAEVEKLLGYALAPARPFAFDRNVDDYGWHVGEDGRHHVTLFVENGRVQDEPGRDFKTGLRAIARVHKGTFRLTANQHVLVADIAPADVPQIKSLLRQYGLDDLSHTGLRLSSSACVAFPTCGLAMAESERVSLSEALLSLGCVAEWAWCIFSTSRCSSTRWRRCARKTACGTTRS
jgi:sulfite reductase (NADPH) hemoprotein beta-component